VILNEDGELFRAYLGGRLVFGSGSCCPQDFLFLTGFVSSWAGDDGTMSSPNIESSSKDCGVRTWFSEKSDEYCVFGLEEKLSTRLSAGDGSNLTTGVCDIVV